jgi:hypothetical protein
VVVLHALRLALPQEAVQPVKGFLEHPASKGLHLVIGLAAAVVALVVLVTQLLPITVPHLMPVVALVVPDCSTR